MSHCFTPQSIDKFSILQEFMKTCAAAPLLGMFCAEAPLYEEFGEREMLAVRIVAFSS